MPVLRLDIPTAHGLARRGGEPLGLRLPADNQPRVWSALRTPKATDDPGHGKADRLCPEPRYACEHPHTWVGETLAERALDGEFRPGTLRALPWGRAAVKVRAGDTLLVPQDMLQVYAFLLSGVGWTVTGRMKAEPAPTLHLTHWFRASDHGPGAVLSVMRRELPRSVKTMADGLVPDAQPSPELLRASRGLSRADALARYSAELDPHALAVGRLWYSRLDGTSPAAVRSGDTLCCDCQAPGGGARRTCHLELLAPALVGAGWRVRLYGRLLVCSEAGIVTYASGQSYSGRWKPEQQAERGAA